MTVAVPGIITLTFAIGNTASFNGSFPLQECQTTFEGHKSFYTIDDMPVCGPCAGIEQ
jgi:hypothetical protein